MNVRTTRIKADPVKAAADGAASYQAMVASMKQVEGFLGAVLLVDSGSGDSLGLTFWASEKAVRASEEVTGAWLLLVGVGAMEAAEARAGSGARD